jgi:hypothetical protein
MTNQKTDLAIHALIILREEKDSSNGAPTTNAILASVAYEELTRLAYREEDDNVELARARSEIDQLKREIEGKEQSCLYEGYSAAYWYTYYIKARNDLDGQWSNHRAAMDSVIKDAASTIPMNHVYHMDELLNAKFGADRPSIPDADKRVVIYYANHGQKIQAIKHLRSFLNSGLRETKELVESL